MTTIFGMKHPQLELAVLAADRQTTLSNEQGIPVEKYLNRKIWHDKDKNFCVGHSGTLDNEIAEFLNNLVENKYDVQKIVEQKNFEELRNINIKKLGRKLLDTKSIFSLVLATRFENKPKLYTCFPLGDVEERFWTTIGSGSQKAQEYIGAIEIISGARDYLSQNKAVSPKDIIQLSLEAVRWSQNKDVYSSGLDLMICTPDDVHDHFSILGDGFKSKLNKIASKYK